MSASRQYKCITENKQIINIIQNSYEIPSQSEPFQAVIKNNRFSLKKDGICSSYDQQPLFKKHLFQKYNRFLV